ncbi:MAG: ATP-binding protein [Thermoplasmata archaeon]|nr:ATP-binding protein [Thermoplasmata archaeon]
MIELQRTRYLSQIEPFIHDGGMIKVLTGMRRCGKSTILRQIMISLQNEPGTSVAYLELDDDVYSNISTPDQLREAIEECFKDNDSKRYLFIDEIQNVESFEKVVEAYRMKDVSVFITGSNSYLLSDEISTKLTGRYIEFRIMPFSFSEVEEYRKLNGVPINAMSDFNDYLIYGGLPKRFDYPSAAAQERYVFAVLSEIKKKDIMARSGIKNKALLDDLVSFVASIPSQEISNDSITEFLQKNGLKVKRDTVKKYLDLIFSSNIASKCRRYDVVGKKTLNTVYKSYLTDLALHTFISGKKDRLDFGMLIENMVYNELISRGYIVTVGKKGGKEIDFVVTDGMRKAYIQAVYLMPTKDVVDREEGPLLAMKDGFPKYIVSMDPITVSDNGIIRLNLVEDFLLGDGFKL